MGELCHPRISSLVGINVIIASVLPLRVWKSDLTIVISDGRCNANQIVSNQVHGTRFQCLFSADDAVSRVSDFEQHHESIKFPSINVIQSIFSRLVNWYPKCLGKPLY